MAVSRNDDIKSNAVNTEDITPLNEKKLNFKDNKVAYIKRGVKKFLKIIWNKRKRQLLGNDGEDWTKISIFYVVFYALLGCFTWVMIAIFMAITGTDRQMPVYVGKESVLDATVVSPGMGIRPHLGVNLPRILYSLSSNNEYIENLNLFLKQSRSSQHILALLDDLDCSPDKHFGYNSSNPCVLIKLNNVFTWEPTGEIVPPSCAQNQTPPYLNNATGKFVYIQCSTSDNTLIEYASIFNEIAQSSTCFGGIPFDFYPYKAKSNSFETLVVIKLNLTANIDYRVTCRAYAQNLVVNSRFGYGTIEFPIKFIR